MSKFTLLIALLLIGRLFSGDPSDEPVFARRLDTYLSLNFTLFL
jgi:hypothetical protein